MDRPTRPKLPRRLASAILGAFVLMTSLGVGSAATAAVTYSTDTPMILNGVTLDDLLADRHGVCSGNFTHIVKTPSGPNNAINYLDAAEKCGLKVIYSFSNTVNYTYGTVDPANVPYWVNLVKDHPALWGYLSVKEPSWFGISASETRSLYTAYKRADPDHPVMALFGDIPHFGQSVNPYTAGMADVLMVDWYPVETTNGTNTIYLTSGPTSYKRVLAYVASKTPGTPIWLMVGTHKNTTPAYHDKQRPSQALLYRQVREGFTYLGATGIAFHTWTNANYDIDQRRDATMVGWMNGLAAAVQAGTFR